MVIKLEPELTIDDSELHRIEKKKLEQEKSEIVKKSLEIDNLKQILQKEKIERIEFKNQIKQHVEELVKKEICKKEYQG